MTKNFRLGIIDNPRKIVKNSLFFPKEFIPNLQKQGIESKIATGFCNFEELYGSIHEWDGFIGHASSIFFGVHESYADKKRIEKILKYNIKFACGCFNSNLSWKERGELFLDEKEFEDTVLKGQKIPIFNYNIDIDEIVRYFKDK